MYLNVFDLALDFMRDKPQFAGLKEKYYDPLILHVKNIDDKFLLTLIRKINEVNDFTPVQAQNLFTFLIEIKDRMPKNAMNYSYFVINNILKQINRFPKSVDLNKMKEVNSFHNNIL